jgi:serine/threonine protein kinase
MFSYLQVADFGMSLNMSGKDTHVSGVRHGTPLYIPPEILKSGKASRAADVFSFGVILWELYHGVSAWDYVVQMYDRGGGGVGLNLKKFALTRFHADNFSYSEDCLLPEFAELGRACVSDDPLQRPTFVEIIAAIDAMSSNLDTGLQESS